MATRPACALFSAHYGDVAGSMVSSRSAEIKEGKSTSRPQRERYKYTALNSDLLGEKTSQTQNIHQFRIRAYIYCAPESQKASRPDTVQRLERELFDAAVK